MHGTIGEGRTVLTAMAVAASLMSSSGPLAAQATMDTMARQAVCEISAIGDTRSPRAVALIRSACNWLAFNGDSLLNESNKGYYDCLVRQLSGAQADEAAAAIAAACRTSNPL